MNITRKHIRKLIISEIKNMSKPHTRKLKLNRRQLRKIIESAINEVDDSLPIDHCQGEAACYSNLINQAIRGEADTNALSNLLDKVGMPSSEWGTDDEALANVLNNILQSGGDFLAKLDAVGDEYNRQFNRDMRDDLKDDLGPTDVNNIERQTPGFRNWFDEDATTATERIAAADEAEAEQIESELDVNR